MNAITNDANCDKLKYILREIATFSNTAVWHLDHPAADGQEQAKLIEQLLASASGRATNAVCLFNHILKHPNPIVDNEHTN